MQKLPSRDVSRKDSPRELTELLGGLGFRPVLLDPRVWLSWLLPQSQRSAFWRLFMSIKVRVRGKGVCSCHSECEVL